MTIDLKKDKQKRLLILGTRGIPAAHGGFETLVEYLAPYLVSEGWSVAVYCQSDQAGLREEREYKGVRLLIIGVSNKGTWGTIVFDWIAMLDALRRPGLLLSLGYPTGAFALLPRLFRRVHLVNMDGIEWKRSQFGWLGKIAYFLNERFAAHFANHLIADHPEIAKHLATRVRKNKITMIAYGAQRTVGSGAALISQLDLQPFTYGVVIARPEPDNSILEIVRGFSQQKRTTKLVVLGKFLPENVYHSRVIESASSQVVFVGSIYEAEILASLRSNALFYAHGHRVGGTNPSLVEALGAGRPIVAMDNEFNRWVARDAAVYFQNEEDFSDWVEVLEQDADLVSELGENAEKRHSEGFTWTEILKQYRELLERSL